MKEIQAGTFHVRHRQAIFFFGHWREFSGFARRPETSPYFDIPPVNTERREEQERSRTPVVPAVISTETVG